MICRIFLFLCKVFLFFSKISFFYICFQVLIFDRTCFEPHILFSKIKALNEEWYKGDGWYGDGPDFHFDYYNSFVIQPMIIQVLDVSSSALDSEKGLGGRRYSLRQSSEGKENCEIKVVFVIFRAYYSDRSPFICIRW